MFNFFDHTGFLYVTCSQDFSERGAFPRLLLVTRPRASLVRAAGEVTEAEVRGEAELLPAVSTFEELPSISFPPAGLPLPVTLPITPLFALFTAWFWCC